MNAPAPTHRYAIRRGSDGFFKTFKQSGDFPRYRAVFTRDPWEAAHFSLIEATTVLNSSFQGQAQVVRLDIVVGEEAS